MKSRIRHLLQNAKPKKRKYKANPEFKDLVPNSRGQYRPKYYGKYMTSDRTRCKYISSEGRECDEWFPIDGGVYCPKYHRNIVDIHNGKPRHLDIINETKAYAYQMTNEELDKHIHCLESEIEYFNHVAKTKLSGLRAVRAERFEKMTAEERKAMRDYQIAQRSNGSKPRKAKVKGKSLAEQMGISLQDMLTLSPEELAAKTALYRKKKNENDDTT
jgi:hypothetical protein